MHNWRLLLTGANHGPFNMALDDWLLNRAAGGTGGPVLRFYTWEPACLSLGYLQKTDDGLPERCRRLGLDLARRPTGGLAVLHGSDLCYSIVAPLGCGPLPAGLREASLIVNRGLQAGLYSLGIPAEISVTVGYAADATACFEAASLYEVTAGGRKLAGSAQLQKQGWLLMHGSLTLELNALTLAAALSLSKQQLGRIQEKADGVNRLAGRQMGVREVTAALCHGFCRELNISPEPGILSAGEADAVERSSNKFTISGSERGSACV
jgi:lipoyl(octanoyl) transferase